MVEGCLCFLPTPKKKHEEFQLPTVLKLNKLCVFIVFLMVEFHVDLVVGAFRLGFFLVFNKESWEELQLYQSFLVWSTTKLNHQIQWLIAAVKGGPPRSSQSVHSLRWHRVHGNFTKM